MKKLTLIISCLFLIGTVSAQRNKVNQKEGSITCTQFGITAPLSKIFKEHPVDENKIYKNEESEDRENRKPQKFRKSVKDGPEYGNDETTMQHTMGDVPGRAPITNWLGQTASGFRPFDPSGAVGPNHYVQMINSTTFKVYNKTTGAVSLTDTLGNLWSPATANAGDPIVLYDKAADRWFLAQFGSSTDKKIYIAISTTGDPTGSYYTYTFVSPAFPDYLKFSVWADGYYMTSNQAQKVFAFERTAMLAGTAGARAVYTSFAPPQGTGFFVPLPGDASDGTLPTVGTPCPIFSYSDNGWGTGYSDAVNIYQMAVNWVPTTPTATITLSGNIPTATFDGTYNASWNDVSQPGTTQKLDGIGGVCMYRAQWKSWSGYNTIVLNWGVQISTSQRSIKWCELRQNQSTGAWTMYQEGIYTPDADTRWMGSIAMDNNGSIAMAYLKSNATTIYPGLYYTGRRSCDPLGTLPITETTVIAGTGSQTGMNRVGDYAEMVLDPDGITFWHTSEYMGGATGGSAASTRIFSFQLASCSTAANVNIAASSSAICTGASVTFTASPTNGGTAPSYQWQVNGANVGTNSPTYTTATLTNGQIVTCVMTSNLAGVTGNPATSNSITMTVAAPVVPAVSISGSTAICAGVSSTFTATPTNGGTTPSYQWQVNGTNAGTNSATFTSSSLTNGQVVTCVMTSNATCPSPTTATSNGLTMTITAAVAPSVSIALSSGSNPTCSGASNTFTATPSNAVSPSYQWKLNGTNVGTNSATYSNSTLLNSDVVTCVMTASQVCPTVVTLGTGTTANITTSDVGAAYPTYYGSGRQQYLIKASELTALGLTAGNISSLGFNVTGSAGNPATMNSYAIKMATSTAIALTTTFQVATFTTVFGPVNYTPTLNAMNTHTLATPFNWDGVSNILIDICFTNGVTGSAAYQTYQTSSTFVSSTYYQVDGTTGSTACSQTTGTTASMRPNITFTKGTSSATSNAVTMTVNSSVAPSVSVNASATSICSGTSVTFTAITTNGGTTPSYQWQVNGVNAGTNSSTFTTTTLTNGQVVTCILTSNLACASPSTATSTGITITVGNSLSPAVSISASATTICAGGSITFTATPTNGGTTPAYQWLVNGANAGTNSSTFTTPALTNGQIVSCVLTSNSSCVSTTTATSNTIAITVNSSVTPSVSVSTTATTICSGTSVTFTATPTNGGTTPSYQWQVNGTNVGTNSATYTSTTLTNGQIVTCILTSNLACVSPATATSTGISMTVNSSSVPSVSVSASSTSICTGTSITFTATPTNGGTTPSYQWQVNGTNVGTNSSTFTSSTITNGQIVTCVMTSNLACVIPLTATSGGITITVSSPVTPSVTISASTTTICAGGSITFTATPTNGGTTPAYQWLIDGANAGTNSSTYTTTSLTNGQVVTCVLTSNAGCLTTTTATSNGLTISVNGTVAPSVSISSTATSICTGTSVTFTASPTNGGTTPSYQWQVNGVNAGTNSSTFTSSTLTNGQVVTCILTSNLSCASPTTATSSGITISVLTSITPSVAVALTSGSSPACFGTAATFTATPSNAVSPSYQWKLNGTNVGTNSATYTNSALANNDVVTCAMTASSTCPTVVTLGTGTAANATTSSVGAAYPTRGGNGRQQYLIKASELTALGLTAGNIASLSFYVTGAAGNPATLNGYNIKMAATAATVLTTTFQVPTFTTVFGPVNYTPTLNALNTHTLTTPFNWNGTSNILIDICFSNGVTGSSAYRTYQTASTFVSTTYYQVNGTAGSTACSRTTGTTASMRPNITFTKGTTTVTSNGVTMAVNALPTVNSTANTSSVCVGSSVTLTGTGATSYSWTGGVTNGTPFMPNATTTYTITGTDANGCVGTSTKTITVNALPTVSSTASATTICAGIAVTLTGTGATSYSWTGGVTNGTAFTPSATTTYTVTGTDANGCVGTSTKTITVNALPTVSSTASASTVCSGTSVILTGTGATSFSWTGGVTNGAAFTPSTTITYTVTGTDANGCVGTSTKIITVNALPTVSSTASASTVCSGTSVTLTGTGATSYSWTGGVTNGTAFTPIATTTYTVTGTDANGCIGTSTKTITVNTLPTVSSTASASTVCSGTSVTLTGTGATSYSWTGSVTNGAAFTPSATTTYTVTGTDANGCIGTSTKTITVNTLPTVSSTASASTVCSGTSVTLTGTGATSYSWTGSVTNGAAFTPSATTTYTVTGTDANGCTGTSMETISVLTNYAISTSAGSNGIISPNGTLNVCSGSSQTFTITPNSGYSIFDVLVDGVSDPIAVATGSYTFTNVLANHTISVSFTTGCVPPSFSNCPINQTIYTSQGLCSNELLYTTSLSGTSPSLSYILSGATVGGGNGDGSGSAFIHGITTVSLSASNGCGVSTCSFNVTVIDNQAPVPDIASLPIITEECTVTVIPPTSMDNCSGLITATTNDPLVYNNQGTYIINWAFDDGNGNQAHRNQTVIIQDVTLPTISAPSDITVCYGEPILLGSPIASDNCGLFSVTNDAPSSFSIGTTLVTWTATDFNGNSASSTQQVVVNPLPIGIASNYQICNGLSTNIALSSSVSGSTFTWTSSVNSGSVIGNGSCSANCSGSIADILNNTGTVTAIVDYSILPISPQGCVGSSFSSNVSVAPSLLPPSITGPNSLCGLTTGAYTAISANATSYNWSVPAGVTITAGQGNSLLSVSYGTAVTGYITASATNSCETSTTTSYFITKKPGTPSAIQGPVSLCGLTTANFSIPTVLGAVSYTWTLPTGITITSGSGTNSVNVSIASTFIVGNIIVTAVNPCGTTVGQILTVYGKAPATPASITGITALCGVTSTTYTATVTSGAAGYLWTLPSGLTIISGTGSNVITVANSGFTGGSITVAAYNACGTSLPRTLALIVAPLAPTSISGPSFTCGLSTATYVCATVAGAVSYNWLVPASVSITSGQGTNSILVTFTSPTSGNISVTASNACATSIARTITISKVIAPGAITGPTVVCGLTTATYSVAAVTGTTSYFWVVPAGMTIASGQLTTSIIVNVPLTMASGLLKVQSQNTCAASGFTSITIGACANGISHDSFKEGYQFSLYPNPTFNQFTIDVTSRMKVSEKYIIEVYDVLGNKIITKEEALSEGTSSIKLDLQDNNVGIYLVRLLDQENRFIYSERVIKE